MSNFEKLDSIPNEVIMFFHRATGIGVLDSRKLLSEASPLFYARLMEAATTQRSTDLENKRLKLHDPIEDCPEYSEALRNAEQLAEIELKQEFGNDRSRMYHLSFCKTKKRILREMYNLDWFSFYDMNPNFYYD